ncbi:MAG: TetR/AcrR family transcriptional regulator [Janthinobacterium lividum]
MQAALQAALLVFWRGGYAATSLDDLTAAMGLSRSSFYGAFGSKHDVLLASVRLYADRIYADLQTLAAAEYAPADCIRAVVGALAKPRRDGNGCLLVNSVAELAPDDLEVCEIARMQVDRVTRLLRRLLAKAGHTSEASEHLSGTLIACAFGASTLRKVGLPDVDFAGLLAQIDRLLEPPSTRGT